MQAGTRCGSRICRRHMIQNLACVNTNNLNQSSKRTLAYKAPFNPGLKSVKDQGISVLKSLTSEIQGKTKTRRLLISQEDIGPTPEQLQEATRLRGLVEDALEEYTSKRGGLFCMNTEFGAEPIAIVDVEITEDLRAARVYWSLPFSILIMDITRGSRARGGSGMEMRRKAALRMQKILEERGGVIQGIVHQKMRRYFRPPTLRFVMAEGEMLRNFLKELI